MKDAALVQKAQQVVDKIGAAPREAQIEFLK